jgi:7-cyano-7-deazaguanine synthase
MKAVVAFSGGQDSTTILAEAVEKYGADQVYTITADYGQKHSREIEAAAKITSLLGVRQLELVGMRGILHSTSPLTDESSPLETYSSPEQMEAVIGDRREKTFVPLRNPLFLTIAANRAVTLGATEVWTGVCQMDNANYDDCREVFVESMEQMINFAIGADHREDVRKVKLVTPLMHLDKAATVIKALTTRAAYHCLGYSHTAYSGEFPPLTQDHATVLRADGFHKAGVPDPLILRAVKLGLMPMPDLPEYAAVQEMVERNDSVTDMLDGVVQDIRDRFGLAAPLPNSDRVGVKA